MNEVIRCTACRKVVAERLPDGRALVRHGGRETWIDIAGSTACPHMSAEGTREGRTVYRRCPGVTTIVCERAS